MISKGLYLFVSRASPGMAHPLQHRQLETSMFHFWHILIGSITMRSLLHPLPYTIFDLPRTTLLHNRQYNCRSHPSHNVLAHCTAPRCLPCRSWYEPDIKKWEGVILQTVRQFIIEWSKAKNEVFSFSEKPQSEDGAVNPRQAVAQEE